MPAGQRLELKVPPEAAYAALVEYVVAGEAARAAIETGDVQRLAQAARSAFELALEPALVDEPEPIAVSATCTPESFVVAISEHGLPIDDAYATNDSRWRAIVDAVHEAHWHSRGTAGSELRLIVKRPLTAQNFANAVSVGDVALAPEQHYVVRRFVPSDARSVERAFFLTYGYNYPFNAVYEPERLCALNAQGRFVSIVAVGEDGEVAGHAALRRENGSPTADFCSAVVLPAHRGRNLLQRLVEECEREAARIGLSGYYGEPVTDHPRTQQTLEHAGAIPCGITLGEYPKNFLAKHMDLSTTTQRQSVLLYAKALTQRDPQTLYPPARHRAIAAEIYERLGLSVRFADGARPTEQGGLRVAIDNGTHTGNITVDGAGVATLERIAQATADLRSMHRLGAIYAALPLDDPGTPALCDALEGLGFFFAGVGPWMLDGRDSLRLQMPLTPIDTSTLTIVSDFGRRLLAYIDDERRRCNSSA